MSLSSAQRCCAALRMQLKVTQLQKELAHGLGVGSNAFIACAGCTSTKARQSDGALRVLTLQLCAARSCHNSAFSSSAVTPVECCQCNGPRALQQSRDAICLCLAEFESLVECLGRLSRCSLRQKQLRMCCCASACLYDRDAVLVRARSDAAAAGNMTCHCDQLAAHTLGGAALCKSCTAEGLSLAPAHACHPDLVHSR